MNDARNDPTRRGAGAPRGRLIAKVGNGAAGNRLRGDQGMSLNDALERIVESGRVGEWMTAADGYLRAPTGVPSADLLPNAHRLLAPVIEHCRGDERGFLRLLEALRSSRQSVADDQLGTLIDKVTERVVRAERKRARSRRAAAILIRAGARGGRCSLTGSVVEATERQIEQAWDVGLIKTLQGMCQVHPRKGLDLDEFEQLHTEFWIFVEDEVTNGRVPLWGAQISIPREQS